MRYNPVSFFSKNRRKCTGESARGIPSRHNIRFVSLLLSDMGR